MKHISHFLDDILVDEEDLYDESYLEQATREAYEEGRVDGSTTIGEHIGFVFRTIIVAFAVVVAFNVSANLYAESFLEYAPRICTLLTQ